MHTRDPVPLDRNFSAIFRSESDSHEHKALAAWGLHTLKQWPEIDEGHRSVILGEAGAGKTYEMHVRAKYMEGQGRASFLIRLEDISEDFEQALEVGCAESFENWLGSHREAWFYLDSVDEARLSNPRDFEKAIRRFSQRIRGAQMRAHVCISSRPYAWRAKSDRDLIERYLPFNKLRTERKGDTSEPVGQVTQVTQSESALQVYWLCPLEEDQIRHFAVHRSTPEVDRLIEELKRLNLLELAGRPFDLEGVLAKWNSDRELGGRRKLLRHNIEARLRESDPDRDSRQPLSLDKAREGARLLAAAVTLTGDAGIRVPDNPHAKTGIDAPLVLAEWDSDDIETLLQRAVFDGVIYGAVRMRHREEREMLAAEWFLELLQKGNSRHAIEALIFRDQYGHQIIAPRLRPILPWLMLDDKNIRNRALAIHPEIALEGGDPAQLPFQERKKILVDIVKQIVSEEEKGTVHHNNAIALIAQSDLTEETLSLIDQHADHDDAIFFLGRLVWQGEMKDCVPRFLDIAGDPARGIYARIAATRAVMTCGTIRQQHTLWNSLLTAEAELPRRLFAGLVQDAPADATSVALLLSSIDKLTPYQRYESTGLTRALRGFTDRLPHPTSTVTSQPLAELARGFATMLDRPPFVDRHHCRISKDFSWLLSPAIQAVERLVSAHSEAAMQDHGIAIMLKRPAGRSWQVGGVDDYQDSLGELIPASPELNDILFWRCVEEERRRIEKDGRQLDNVLQVQWRQPYWSFAVDALPRVLDWVKARELEDDRLVALSLAIRIYAEGGRHANTLTKLQETVAGDAALEARLDRLRHPTVSEHQRKLQEENLEYKQKLEQQNSEQEQVKADWIARLKANPDRVRNPPGIEPGGFSNDQCWLFREVEGNGQRSSRGEGAAWESLIDEFGIDVARAYRDAAMSHWRHYKPGLRSENPAIQPEGSSGRVISYSLLFAMAGLEIEAQEVKDFPEHLSESEVRHALRYITLELNGFPSWLEAMYRTYPQAVIDAIQSELFWELANTQPGQHLHHILDDLNVYAPWLHTAIAGPLLDRMRAYDVPSCDALGGCFSIMRGSNVKPTELATVAQSKVAAGQPDDHLPYWYALWVDSKPNTGIPAVAHWLDSLGSSEESSHAAQLFISILMGTTRGRSSGPHNENFRTAKHLKALYVLMHRHIRSEEDTDRASGRVYTPELRDNAQDARNALFRFLSEIPGKAAYVAIEELVEDHPDPDTRPWMARHAFERAEQDGDIEPWTEEQVHEFGSRLTLTPSTHRQLYDLTLDRLTDLRNWIEQGTDSPFQTWQRAKSESELRNLVAGWLNQNWGNSLTAAQEPALANNQRMDIWLQSENVQSPVPIELKVLDKNWSGPKLCERLRNQLAGDYLKHEREGCGVMLLAWLGSSDRRRWRINGSLVEISGLRKALKNYWAGISNNFPNVAAIEIILIDMTIRANKSQT